MSFTSLIAHNLGLQEKQVANTLKLLNEGASIPFISRYRKEMTQGLNEVQIQEIQEQFEKFSELERKKKSILKTIDEQGKLTEQIKKKVADIRTMAELEDFYLPYKPKRRTRAEIAREKGLEPLAKILMAQMENNIESRALAFVKGDINDVEDALKGAREIISEWINENESARNKVRRSFAREAVITSSVIKEKEQEAEKYKDYFEFSEPLRKISSHRLLAILRGEKEKFLRVSISPDDENTIETLQSMFVKGYTEASKQVAKAVVDAYKRLIKPSIETEFFNQSKEKADEQAIQVFAQNLRQLLLSPPLGQKRVLAIDPGFRTGCKVVCLDSQGSLLHNETIYPHPPQNEKTTAAKKITQMVEAYRIEAISIGNGTASRETEDFIKNLRFDREIQVFIVSEDGASVYSASPVAREEFPEYDVTVRGAVSIGRRLMDPLAELVKIDPKSIGVGQYQHDVDQPKLKKSLDMTVINCVNLVGVNLNTAGKHLLTYVSGLGPQLAQNVVEYRTEKGHFTSRDELKKVPQLGEKTYEQCAGFLRISDSANPLDNTAVHPESYSVVEKMARKMKCSVPELIANKELRKEINLQDYVSEKTGLPTLKDIMEELDKPGRDLRKTIRVFEFDPTIKTIDDLRVGMQLPGIVTNITNFGAFVDIGIKENGLIHVSQLADKFISNPAEIVSIHQHVEVKIIEIDKERKRIQLSMKS